jgi:hypothetical protein
VSGKTSRRALTRSSGARHRTRRNAAVRGHLRADMPTQHPDRCGRVPTHVARCGSCRRFHGPRPLADQTGVILINPSDRALFAAVRTGILLCRVCHLARRRGISECDIFAGRRLNASSRLGNCAAALGVLLDAAAGLRSRPGCRVGSDEVWSGAGRPLNESEQ